MKYWLAKTEPYEFSWEDMLTANHACWDGIRNYQARNYLRDMKKGDLVFIYHSNQGLEIVGTAEVITESYSDPKADDPKWLAVDLKPLKALLKPVSLKAIKSEPELSEIALLKQSRLSIVPIKKEEYERIMEMSV
jgi:predicted RNA-binding protein with PUA-like domain